VSSLRKYNWPGLQVGGCLTFRITEGLPELDRIRISAYNWAERNAWRISCWHLYGVILFVVRHPDESVTVGAPELENTPCPDDPAETRCKEWRLYVPTVRHLDRRPLLAPKTAPKWGQRRQRRNERRSSLPVYTVSPSGRVQLLQPR